MRLLHYNRNDAMCCIGRGAKIVTQKTTEVGERWGLELSKYSQYRLITKTKPIKLSKSSIFVYLVN